MTKILTLALSAIFCVALAAPVFAHDVVISAADCKQVCEEAGDKSAAEADKKASKEKEAEKAPAAAEKAPAAAEKAPAAK